MDSVGQARGWTGALWELSVECGGEWGCGCVLQKGLITDWCVAYTGAAVVRQRAAVGQRYKLLLPLLVERAAAPLPQDTLRKGPITESESR